MEQDIKVETQNTGSSGLAFNGIWQVFLSPIGFFTKLKNNPKIFVPIIIIAIVSVVMMIALSDLIVQMQIDNPQVQEQLQGQPMPETQKNIMKYTTIGFGVIAMILIPFITALFAMIFSSFVMSSKVNYSKILSVTMYGMVLYMIGNLAIVPLVLAKGSMTVSLSLGTLVADQGPQSLAFVALSKIGLFYIWEIIVVGIGFSIFYGESRNKGYILSVLSVGMLSILHVLITAIFV